MTKYVPKRMHFSTEGMEARTQLAALDNNAHVGRAQAKTSSGDLRYKVQFSRHKNDFVAKRIFESKTYEHVQGLMDHVEAVAVEDGTVEPVTKKPRVSISRRTPPLKSSVVANLQTRMEMSKEYGPHVAMLCLAVSGWDHSANLELLLLL